MKQNTNNIIYSLRSKDEFVTMCGVLLKDKNYAKQLKQEVAKLTKISKDQKDKEIFVDLSFEGNQSSSGVQKSGMGF